MANNAFALDKWVKAESKNFIVYSNIPEHHALAYTKKLEQFRYIISGFYNINKDNSSHNDKFEIYLLRHRGQFEIIYPNIRSGIAGFVRNCPTGTYAYSHFDGEKITEAKDIKVQEENLSLNIIFHEYTHLFMFQNSTVYYPKWFIEGYAEYYSTMRISGDRAVVGMALSLRSISILSLGTTIDYKYILKNKLSKRQDNEFLMSFYAQSWLLTHYLMADPERLKKLKQYFAEINEGKDEIETFERIFAIKLENLSYVLKAYYLKDIRATIYRVSSMPEPVVEITNMPKSADNLLLLNAAAINCPKQDYKPKLLSMIEKEAAKFPNDDYAKMVLANAYIYVGPEEKAVDFYKTYTATNPNDAKGFFNLGLTYYLMAKNNKFLPNETYESQIKLARSLFGKSYKLNPANAVNLYHFSITGPNTGIKPDESSYNAALEAYLSYPLLYQYAYNAMIMQLRNGDLEDVKFTMQSVTSNPHLKEEYKERINLALEAIEAKEPIENILKILSYDIAKTQSD